MNDADVMQPGTASDQPPVEPMPEPVPEPVDELSSPPPAEPPPPPPAPPVEPDPAPAPVPEPPAETPPPTVEDHMNGVFRDIVAALKSLANEPRYAGLRVLALSIEERLGRINDIIHPPEERPVD